MAIKENEGYITYYNLDGAFHSQEILNKENLAESKYSFVGREFVRFADKAQDDKKMTELSQALGKKSLKKCFFI